MKIIQQLLVYFKVLDNEAVTNALTEELISGSRFLSVVKLMQQIFGTFLGRMKLTYFEEHSYDKKHLRLTQKGCCCYIFIANSKFVDYVHI